MASASTRVRVPCSRCGAPIGFVDGADALACPHCGASFFVAHAGSAGWMVPPGITARDAALAARRSLREAKRRVRRILAPQGLLVPLYWLRGRRMCWQLAVADDSLTPSAGTQAEALEHGERFFLRAEAHVLPAHPLSGMWPGGATRLSSRTLDLLDPDRLPEGFELVLPTRNREAVLPEAAAWRDWKRGRPREGWVGSEVLLEERMNLVSVPLFQVGFVSEGEASSLWVDGLTGRVTGEVRFENAESGETFLPEGTVRLIPLECRICGWELRVKERDRIHACRNCGRAWEVTGEAAREVPQWTLGEGPSRGGVRLPFWRFSGPEAGPAEILVPAYAGRHALDQLRLGLGLSRRLAPGDRRPLWAERPEGAAVGSAEASAWAAVMRARLASAAHVERREAVADLQERAQPLGLLWLAFVREGGDLVQRETGVRVRALGTRPWISAQAA